MALTPYAVAAAPAIAMADSPFLPFGDALAGALIGLSYIHDTWPDDPPAYLADENGEDGGSCPDKEPTPSTDPDDFDPWRKVKKNKKTGEIWEQDPSRHGGEHYEVYKNKKMYEKGVRNRAVWSDGSLKKKW
jgi:hypothetical protein